MIHLVDKAITYANMVISQEDILWLSDYGGMFNENNSASSSEFLWSVSVKH